MDVAERALELEIRWSLGRPNGFFWGGHVPLGNLVTVGFDSPWVP